MGEDGGGWGRRAGWCSYGDGALINPRMARAYRRDAPRAAQVTRDPGDQRPISSGRCLPLPLPQPPRAPARTASLSAPRGRHAGSHAGSHADTRVSTSITSTALARGTMSRISPAACCLLPAVCCLRSGWPTRVSCPVASRGSSLSSSTLRLAQQGRR